MKRENIINQLLDTMSVAKRSMFMRMQSIALDSHVSAGHLELLGTIAHLQPSNAKQLANHLQLSAGAISQLVDGLTQQGLIERGAPNEDRRVHNLSITTDGKRLLERISGPRRRVMEELMEQLTDEELTVWLHIQQTMITQFQNSVSKELESKDETTNGIKV